MDDVAAIQLLNDLDEAGMTEIVADLAKAEGAHDDEDEIDKAYGTMTEAEKKRFKAARKIMGPAMAKRFMKPGADAEDEEEEPEAKRKNKKKMRKADATNTVETTDMPAQFTKSADGSYDLSSLPEDQQPAVLAILMKADEDRVRLEKTEGQLAAMIEKEDRQAFLSKAAGLTHLPGVKPEDFADVLRAAAKGMKPEQFQKLEATLTKADTMISKSAFYNEIGSAAAGNADDPSVELETRAMEVLKSDKTMTIEVAKSRILKNDRGNPYYVPGLADRIIKAHDAKMGKRGS